MPDDNMTDLTPAEKHAASPDRLVFLSDGVIAIIITILVLDIRVPELGSGKSIGDSLTEARPTFTSFVLSFLLVGMFWTPPQADVQSGALHRSQCDVAQSHLPPCIGAWSHTRRQPSASTPRADGALPLRSRHGRGVLLRLALNTYYQTTPACYGSRPRRRGGG